MRGRLVVILGVAALVGACAAAGWGSVGLVGPRSGSFVSLWAPGGARYVTVEQFSLRSGRRLARLATESRSKVEVSALYPDSRGALWITKSFGPRCTQRGFGDCLPLVPNSCRSKIAQLDPSTGTSRYLTSFPHSEIVTAAIPSLRGPLVALRTAPCTRSYFNEHFVVENWRTHRRWSIGSDAPPCHGLANPGWNAAGTRLVFAYGPSRLKPGGKWPAATGRIGCRSPRPGGIVIVSAQHASKTHSWHLIHAPSGCAYESAAFDNKGIAAVEACSPNHRGQNYSAGPGYVVQLTQDGRHLFHLALRRGADLGFVQSDARTGLVLVSEDLGDTNRNPNLVWRLQGHHLRLIARYPASQMTFTAQPW
jgi:hypothetical protein